MDPLSPRALDLKKDRGLTIQWSDGATSFYSIALLRRMSPSADMRQLREEIKSNPLTVLPTRPGSAGPLVAVDARLVGNYAIQIEFSDGHGTGIYTWSYLRSLDPALTPRPDAPPGTP